MGSHANQWSSATETDRRPSTLLERGGGVVTGGFIHICYTTINLIYNNDDKISCAPSVDHVVQCPSVAHVIPPASMPDAPSMHPYATELD